ncbi:MAG TPA: cell division protein ZapA [Chiayiivirga sp.]|uniref:Cell division protein ZapA n=1 Tax=Denitratimonas tolerans TaxID=1338420 RepID=A0AAW9RAF7_9GAMM|nr:cell division protein ZapA [Xanthomonadaceae bacterium]HRN60058.1 cell division protein ZapA [Chiayiivirga sp.]HRO87002.1 cell division protein ZapA [Chiayiivirga sp.]HRQ35696.1 cell division protein ZapA [Chiayiivirga sp.]
MSEPVNVRIADREYMVACEPHEREGLIEAARLLDGRMREIRAANRMAGIDRIAVLAALNLAHELSQTRRTDDRDQREIALTLDDLSRKMDRLLAAARR